jgi:hypothetical protein
VPSVLVGLKAIAVGAVTVESKRRLSRLSKASRRFSEPAGFFVRFACENMPVLPFAECVLIGSTRFMPKKRRDYPPHGAMPWPRILGFLNLSIYMIIDFSFIFQQK